MHAVVVYESFWGNTAAVARAIAEGIGPEASAMTTDDATPEVVAAADLVVVGAPVLGFQLPTDQVRASLLRETSAPTPPDTAHRSMRTWLEALPIGRARVAAFETRFRFSPGGSIGTIEHDLERVGHRVMAKGRKFLVTGKYGPLKAGELERAREWGIELATAAQHGAPS
jgi:flavorubredoxin